MRSISKEKIRNRRGGGGLGLYDRDRHCDSRDGILEGSGRGLGSPSQRLN